MTNVDMLLDCSYLENRCKLFSRLKPKAEHILNIPWTFWYRSAEHVYLLMFNCYIFSQFFNKFVEISPYISLSDCGGLWQTSWVYCIKYISVNHWLRHVCSDTVLFLLCLNINNYTSVYLYIWVEYSMMAVWDINHPQNQSLLPCFLDWHPRGRGYYTRASMWGNVILVGGGSHSQGQRMFLNCSENVLRFNSSGCSQNSPRSVAMAIARHECEIFIRAFCEL